MERRAGHRRLHRQNYVRRTRAHHTIYTLYSVQIRSKRFEWNVSSKKFHTRAMRIFKVMCSHRHRIQLMACRHVRDKHPRPILWSRFRTNAHSTAAHHPCEIELSQFMWLFIDEIVKILLIFFVSFTLMGSFFDHASSWDHLSWITRFPQRSPVIRIINCEKKNKN